MPAACHETPSAGGNHRLRAIQATRRIAIVGNPNSGKTTVFNSLTGLRQKVGNYPGVTVEKKEGQIKLSNGQTVTLIDLPGVYSLTPRSPDEIIARDVLLGRRQDTKAPEAVINVVDASNIERNLYFTTQILELGLPTLVVLTMTDVAARQGRRIDEIELSDRLGVPVVTVIASKKIGLTTLLRKIGSLPSELPSRRALPYDLPSIVQAEFDELMEMVATEAPGFSVSHAYVESVNLLMTENVSSDDRARYSADLLNHVANDKANFLANDFDIAEIVVEARYGWIEDIVKTVVKLPPGCAGLPDSPEAIKMRRGIDPVAEKIDKVLLHRFWGYVIFFAVMGLVFQAVYTWAQIPMNWITSGIEWLGNLLTAHMPPGDLRDLVVKGILSGVGTTITFLPQILILFCFICLLEDTGYLARAAFLMDKLMSKVGLHGKSFIPLLSSFACAIPGIMATRTIDDRKSRLVTILVAPLMSCSARLPVYVVMIGAFIPHTRVLGIFDLPGITMIVMYLLGTFAAFGMAWLFKKTLLRSASPRFLMELPPYHLPSARSVIMQMLERTGLFLKRAGTVIASVSIVIWCLSSYPKMPAATPTTQLSNSYAGKIGHFIEPTIAPLGFDWRIGVSLVSSFVAREVFISSMATIYSVGNQSSDPDQVAAPLQQQLRADHRFSPLLAVCVMVYYVLAMQCMSTVAVVKRETGGWKWPLFQMGYMTVLAWVATFAVWHIGRALGY